MPPNPVELVAAIIDPNAWTGEEPASVTGRQKLGYRRTHSLKKARAIVAAIAGSLLAATIEGQPNDTSAHEGAITQERPSE